MKQELHIASLATRPNDSAKLDIPPASTGEALKADVRRMQQECAGVYETIAELALVTPGAVYKWFERPGHRWPVSDVEAVVRATGGLNFQAWLRRLGGPALRRLRDGYFEVLEDLALATERMAKITSQTARDLAPDDESPGELDREERRLLVAQLGKIRVALDAIAAAVGEEG